MYANLSTLPLVYNYTIVVVIVKVKVIVIVIVTTLWYATCMLI